MRKKADAGDKTAQLIVASIPKDAPSQRRLLEGLKLTLRKDMSFVFMLPDRTTGRVRETSGTYTVESGTKLTLSITSIDGKKAEGVDAKAVSMTYDDKDKTVTCDTGGGPKLVMQKR